MGGAGAHTPQDGGRGWPPETRPSPRVLPWQIWSLQVKRYGVNKRVPKNGGQRGSAWLVLHRKTSGPDLCYDVKFGRSRSKIIRTRKENRRKQVHRASRLLGSLNIIETDTDRSATYDFLLVTHSDNGPISYHSRDKRPYRSIIANFSHPVHLTTPLRALEVF